MASVPEYFLQIKTMDNTKAVDSMFVDNYCIYKYTNDFRIILNLNLDLPIYFVKKRTNIAPCII